MHKYTHIMCMLNANLREEGVEAVDLLSLLHVGVVLCHALQRQLIHQVYGVRTVKVVPLCVYIHVHTCRYIKDLPLLQIMTSLHWGGNLEQNLL